MPKNGRTREPSRVTRMATALDHLERAQAELEAIDGRTFPRTGPVRGHVRKSRTSIEVAIKATTSALKLDTPRLAKTG